MTRDKQTIAIISLGLLGKLTDKDTMPRSNEERVYVDPRDLAILQQMLPDSEIVARIAEREVIEIPGRWTVRYNCAVAEVKRLLQELDSIRKE